MEVRSAPTFSHSPASFGRRLGRSAFCFFFNDTEVVQPSVVQIVLNQNCQPENPETEYREHDQKTALDFTAANKDFFGRLSFAMRAIESEPAGVFVYC